MDGKGVKMTTNKAIIFDASTLITFSMNGLYEELRKLKKVFGGRFFITTMVREEIIDKPVQRKRFELEALRLQKLLEDGVLEMPQSIGIKREEVEKQMNEYMDIANNIFSGRGDPIKLIHYGESSCLGLYRILKERGWNVVMAVDERTLRMLVEKPDNLRELLQRKLHTNVQLNKKNFAPFKGFKIIRSTELAYILHKKKLIDIGNGKALDALLWAMKFKGCSISDEEIKQIKRLG